MRFLAGAATDKGQVRDGNEDAYVVDPRLRLFAVADGMGGHRGGEIASATALEALRAAIASGTSIGDAVAVANAAVFEKAGDDNDLMGMGTTLTAVTPDERGLAIGHVGDSRAYLLRDGELRQLTTDHSLVEELVREGRLTEDQAAVHPQRSIITRALGVEHDVEVDVYAIVLRPGDRLLLCSDGLTTMLRATDIAAVLRREPDPARAANLLVDAANDAGGEDNITTLVIDVEADAQDPLGADALPLGDAMPDASHAESPAPPALEMASPPDPVTTGALAQARADRRRRVHRTGLAAGRLARYLVPIVLILGLAVAAVAWYARRTYFVAFDPGGHVVVYQGRPGGLLLWDPTVVRRYSATKSDVADPYQSAIADRKEFANRGEALAYVLRVTTTTTTTTTSTTSSTTTTLSVPPT